MVKYTVRTYVRTLGIENFAYDCCETRLLRLSQLLFPLFFTENCQQTCQIILNCV